MPSNGCQMAVKWPSNSRQTAVKYRKVAERPHGHLILCQEAMPAIYLYPTLYRSCAQVVIGDHNIWCQSSYRPLRCHLHFDSFMSCDSVQVADEVHNTSGQSNHETTAGHGSGLSQSQSPSQRNAIDLDEHIFWKSGDFHCCPCRFVLAKN